MKRVFRVTEPGKVKDIGLRGLGEAPEWRASTRRSPSSRP